MPWRVSISTEGTYIDVVFSGVVAISDFAQAYDQVTLLSDGPGPKRVLMDLRAVKKNVASLTEIFFEVERRRTSTGSHVMLRRAVVLPTDPVLMEKAKFFVTTSINSAFQLNDFPDRKSALEWLLKD